MVLGRWRVTSDAASAMQPIWPRPGKGPRGQCDGDILRFDRPTDIAFAPNGDSSHSPRTGTEIRES